MKEKKVLKLLTGLKENPIGVMDTAILSCGLEKPLTEEDVKTLSDNVSFLIDVPKSDIRAKLQELLLSSKAGRGLRLCLEIGALPYILGEECVFNSSKREFEAFVTLSYKVDDVAGLDYREALLFMCFEKPRAISALNYLEYDEDSKEIYKTNTEMLDDLAFIGNKLELKKFIYTYGWDYYNYLNILSKQQRKVYDLNEYRILSRKYLIEEIKKFKEPVFEDELAITENELMEAGIVERDEAANMKAMLLDLAHKTPRINTREQLLKKAKFLTKMPFAKHMRKIRWIK